MRPSGAGPIRVTLEVAAEVVGRERNYTLKGGW